MIVHPHTTIHLAEHVSAISQFLKRDSVSISQYSTPYLIIKGGQCEFTNEKRQFKNLLTWSFQNYFLFSASLFCGDPGQKTPFPGWNCLQVRLFSWGKTFFVWSVQRRKYADLNWVFLRNFSDKLSMLNRKKFLWYV